MSAALSNCPSYATEVISGKTTGEQIHVFVMPFLSSPSTSHSSSDERNKGFYSSPPTAKDNEAKGYNNGVLRLY
jgi:hypothetical protein